VQLTFVPSFVSAEVQAWAREDDASGSGAGRPAELDWWPRAPLPGEDPRAVVASRPPAAQPDEVRAQWLAGNPRPDATVAQVADHVDHAREVAGVDHIGLGGDFDGTDAMPAGLADVSGYPRLLEELADRGWSQSELEKLTGRNVLRVLHEADRLATEPLWPHA
jgi:membrane dipeptidase